MNEFLKKMFPDEIIDVVKSIEELPVSEGGIYILGVSREAIERGHLQTYMQEFEKLGKKKMRSRVWMTFEGYDYDPREVYQIPEVRDWMARMLKNVPHLFYFLSKDGYSIRIAFASLAKIEAHANGQTQVNLSGAKALIEKITQAAVSYSRKKKDSAQEQFALASTIMDECGYDQVSN